MGEPPSELPLLSPPPRHPAPHGRVVIPRASSSSVQTTRDLSIRICGGDLMWQRSDCWTRARPPARRGRVSSPGSTATSSSAIRTGARGPWGRCDTHRAIQLFGGPLPRSAFDPCALQDGGANVGGGQARAPAGCGPLPLPPAVSSERSARTRASKPTSSAVRAAACRPPCAETRGWRSPPASTLGDRPFFEPGPGSRRSGNWLSILRSALAVERGGFTFREGSRLVAP